MTEALITCAVLALVVGSIYNLLSFGQKSWEATSEGSEAQLSARLAMGRVIKDLREAKEEAGGGEAIAEARSGQIIFYANVDSDSNPERIRYFVSNQIIKRGVTEYDEAQGYGGRETEETLAKSVQAFSLQYADLNSSSLNPPLDQSQRAQIRMITVSLETDVDPDKQPPATSVKSVARLRNLSFAD